MQEEAASLQDSATQTEEDTATLDSSTNTEDTVTVPRELFTKTVQILNQLYNHVLYFSCVVETDYEERLKKDKEFKRPLDDMMTKNFEAYKLMEELEKLPPIRVSRW